MKDFKFEIVENEITHISFRGHRQRNPTVLIRVGRFSLSKKAAILGLILIACQVVDGFLTYLGLRFTVNMEGNQFLALLMELYGIAPALFIVKCAAVALVIILTWRANRRRWMRPVIFALIAIYLVLAIVPWTMLLSHARATGMWGEHYSATNN